MPLVFSCSCSVSAPVLANFPTEAAMQDRENSRTFGRLWRVGRGYCIEEKQLPIPEGRRFSRVAICLAVR